MLRKRFKTGPEVVADIAEKLPDHFWVSGDYKGTECLLPNTHLVQVFLAAVGEAGYRLLRIRK